MAENSELFNQHSVLKSVLLHLLPGIPILLGIFLFALPGFATSLGFGIELRTVLGLTFSVLFILVPIDKIFRIKIRK